MEVKKIKRTISENRNINENNTNENNNITNEKNEQKEDENYKKEIIGGKSVLVNKKTNKILFTSIQVDIDENEARRDVNSLINQQRQKAADFDKNINVIRKTLGGDEVAIPSKINNDPDNDNENDMQIERLDKLVERDTVTEAETNKDN